MYEPKHSERYWEILQLNIEWLRFSETKATLILTVYGIIFTIAYTNSTAVFESLKDSFWIVMLIFAYGAASLTSITYAFLCVNPALKNPNSTSIIYFGHIYKDLTQAAYKARAKAIIDDEEKLTDQITEQIHTISKIAWIKYRNVGWSLRFFIGSLVIILIAIFSYLIKNL
jgi:hypothetical protein